LKLSIENCGQIAADKRLLLTAYKKLPVSYSISPSLTPYDLPFSHSTTRLAYHILRYDPLRSSKVNDFHVIWKQICDFLLVINSNLGPDSHRLATIRPWQTTTDRQTDRRQTTTVP